MVDHFHIFVISDHSSFEEQLNNHCTDFSYEWTADSLKDSPPILSGKPAHGGVALFWNISIDDLVTHLENSDFPFFISSIYLHIKYCSMREFLEMGRKANVINVKYILFKILSFSNVPGK